MSEHKQSRWRHYLHGFKNLWTYYRGWKWLVFLGLSAGLVLSVYLLVIAKTTSVETLQTALQSETTIYDHQGEYAGTLQSQKGSYVPLDQIAEPMQVTVVTTEDKRFYQHDGFDTMGMGRAFVRLLINRDTSGGGGSTITQQLVKNAFLTLDQTFQRKFKELFLALEVEKQYTKDQILEMYLNHAYFGNGVWGIEDASLKYFGHSADSLNWNESAVLTGMLKGPTIFNPIDDYQAAIDRRNVVADLLAKEGVLDADTVATIKASDIYLNDQYYIEKSYQYPYYFDAVIDEAARLAHIPEDDLLGKGYRIYTNLNQGYQQALDQSYANDWMFPDAGSAEPIVQSASVVINPENGGVAAIYGGRGEYVYRGFNRAIDMKRSPGSTIKPLAVYVPALEAGYNIHTPVPDVVKGYGPENYAPKNYDLQTDPSGEVPLYYALAQSKNTSAVHLMNELGIGKSVAKLDQFGIQIPKVDQRLTLALGALSEGVTPLAMADAYGAFANRGVRYDSHFIQRIEDAAGNVVYELKKPRQYMVMTSRVAADMTSMMLDTYGGYGTAYGAGPDYGQIAGKTGSTEVAEGSTETRDRWMIGYTPDFVVVTWSGLDEVGGQSLDELMPSGMGALFNQQTTGLMGASPQTPFQVTMASQMEADTNTGIEAAWQDQADQVLDSTWQTASEYGQDALNFVQDKLGQLGQAVSDWWSTVDLPF